MTVSRSDIAKGFLVRLEAVSANQATKELAALLLYLRIHNQIEDILLEVERQYKIQHGIVEGEARTPRPLTKEMLTSLSDIVRSKTNGARSVTLHQVIDSSLLGGVVVSTPDLTLDVSLKSKLYRLGASV